MPNKKDGQIEARILSLWSKENGELKKIKNKDIILALESDPFSERTINRYLSALVNDEKLERTEDGYMPPKEYWETLIHSKQQVAISEASLNRIGTYVIADTLKPVIMDAKKTTRRVEARVWNEINANLPKDEKEDNTPAFTNAIETVLNQKKLTKKEREKLHKLIDSLTRDSMLKALTNPTVFTRLDPEDDLPYILQQDVWKLVKKFMAVWVFLYKQPQAVPELEKYLRRMLP